MSRYFDDSSVATVTCKRCGENGHTTSSCKKDYLSVSKCLLCAQTGHLVSDCPQKLKAETYDRSRSSRRSMQSAYEDDNEDGAICIVCGGFDHINCGFEVESDLLPLDSCPKCGGKGHNEKTCPKRDFNAGKPSTRGGRHSWSGSFEPRGGHRKFTPSRHTRPEHNDRGSGGKQKFLEGPKKRAYGSTGSAGGAKRQRVWS